jgi:hypothetical protein
MPQSLYNTEGTRGKHSPGDKKKTSGKGCTRRSVQETNTTAVRLQNLARVCSAPTPALGSGAAMRRLPERYASQNLRQELRLPPHRKGSRPSETHGFSPVGPPWRRKQRRERPPRDPELSVQPAVYKTVRAYPSGRFHGYGSPTSATCFPYEKSYNKLSPIENFF